MEANEIQKKWNKKIVRSITDSTYCLPLGVEEAVIRFTVDYKLDDSLDRSQDVMIWLNQFYKNGSGDLRMFGVGCIRATGQDYRVPPIFFELAWGVDKEQDVHKSLSSFGITSSKKGKFWEVCKQAIPYGIASATGLGQFKDMKFLDFVRNHAYAY